MSDFYDEVMHLPPVGRSDHQCLLLSPKIKHKVKPTSRKVRLRKPYNLAALGLKLNLEEWNLVFQVRDVNLPYVISYTKRHQQSFIPRAISLLK